jgi:hypothetical protein
MKYKRYLIIGMSVMFLLELFCGISIAGQNDTQPALADQLKTQYKLAKMAMDSSGWSVVEAGTVLVIQKGGILGVPSGNVVMAPATYKDGDLHRPNSFGAAMVGQDTRQLTVGEKVYITKIDVHAKNDKIMLTIVECDSCNGVQRRSSYKSEVVFQFPKDYLSKADASQIKDVINLVLAPDANGQQQQAQAQPEQAAAPDQSAAAPQTIQLGQTIEQVKAAWGQPEKIVDLGQKQIYVYKDLKIIFVNGRVADVQ